MFSKSQRKCMVVSITEEVKKHIRECIQCKIYENQKVETLEMIPLMKGSWEMVGSDIFKLKGKKYILIVDYYSKYIKVSILDKGETSKTIIDKINILKTWNTGQFDFRQRKTVRIGRVQEICREI